ncbi:glycosyltransferase family 4 protein [Novosphingobium aquimarinum]|uniref:glycosyltransferase family 4 protein n=1 Tax=Novosphingobium aquimarinum TaxID=2682494 RepID=UPI0018DD4560|nr:glycosyltransferase family 4 protein [Novosphingobium aquimarinum]
MIILGGSLHHPGGLEAFCERATTAITNHAEGWRAEWVPTETAYFQPTRRAGIREAWRKVSRLQQIDVIWLQWSTLLDLLFLILAKRRGFRVLVTPHLGAGARLQRSSILRRVCKRWLTSADGFALLFDEQDREIDLPDCVRRSVVGTFLPRKLFDTPILAREGPELRLLHAGRLSEQKGTFRMIELCRHLHDRQIAFSAMIVGRSDSETAQSIQSAIAASGIEEKIALRDWMDGHTLRQTLTETDVLVHLSELDSFPLIVLEAQIAGAVAIVADMAGASNMVRNYGGFVTQQGEVAAAADWLAHQDVATLRLRAADAAALARRDYAWDVVAGAVAKAADYAVASKG